MSNLHVIDHPLIQHKLTIMRETQTGAKDFRELLNEITTLMGYEITRDFPLCDKPIDTPLCKMIGKTIDGKKVAICNFRDYCIVDNLFHKSRMTALAKVRSF